MRFIMHKKGRNWGKERVSGNGQWPAGESMTAIRVTRSVHLFPNNSYGLSYIKQASKGVISTFTDDLTASVSGEVRHCAQECMPERHIPSHALENVW
jgi:hypothetical protein